MQTIKVRIYTEIPNNYTGIAEYSNGSKFWYLNGKYHRVDGPAVEHSNGYKCWYLNGRLHRVDGPAREFANGTKFWYINGKCLGVFDPVVPFVFLEEFVNEEGKKQIKVLTQEGIKIWPNLPGLKELADNWRT